MQLLTFRADGRVGLAASRDGKAYRGLLEGDASYPGSLDQLIRQRPRPSATPRASRCCPATPVDLAAVEVLQPLSAPGKIICVGLNYRDHASESGMTGSGVSDAVCAVCVEPDPAWRADRAAAGIRHSLDYEGELVAVIGKGGRRIGKADALDHVAGYSIFNDGSIRDFQLRTPQWTMGKNFDATGAFGPVFVTADALPPGARGLKIETRLNGQTMQSASTERPHLRRRDARLADQRRHHARARRLIVTGTPSGVGAARKPPVFMKAGDVCEVEIEGIGVLRNSGRSTRANPPRRRGIARRMSTRRTRQSKHRCWSSARGRSAFRWRSSSGLRGIAVTLVEQRSRTGAQPRAKTTNARSMQHMRRWGIADALRAAAPLPYDYPTDIVFTTALFGRTLAVIENAFEGAKRRDPRFPEPAQWVPQYTVEKVLHERIARLPSVRILSGTVLEDFTQSASGRVCDCARSASSNAGGPSVPTISSVRTARAAACARSWARRCTASTPSRTTTI